MSALRSVLTRKRPPPPLSPRSTHARAHAPLCAFIARAKVDDEEGADAAAEGLDELSLDLSGAKKKKKKKKDAAPADDLDGDDLSLDLGLSKKKKKKKKKKKDAAEEVRGRARGNARSSRTLAGARATRTHPVAFKIDI